MPPSRVPKKRVHLTPEEKVEVSVEIAGFIEMVNSTILAEENPELAEAYTMNLDRFMRRPSKTSLDSARRVMRGWSAEERNWVTANELGHPGLVNSGVGGFLLEKDAMTALGIGRATLRKVATSKGDGLRLYDPFELAEVKNHPTVTKARALIHRRNNPPRPSALERISGKDLF